MPPLDHGKWTGRAGSSQQVRGRAAFLQRYLWPPTLVGLLVIVVVLAIVVGLISGLYFARSQAAQVELQDPAGPDQLPDLTVPDTGPVQTTTTEVPVLSVAALGDRVAPSLWKVSTFDEEGRPVEASAFVAGSFGGQSFLITAFAAVRAATTDPGAPITVSNGGSEAEATLWTWQEDRDLALLVVDRSSPPLLWASEDPEGSRGDRVFVAAPGAGLQSGTILESSATAIQVNIVVDERRQGAALVNERGEVLGMASRAYNPGDVGTDRIFVAVPMQATCGRVLSCGDGDASAASTSTTAP